jgi:selenide,water dikinase
LEIEAARVPQIPGALDLAARGLLTSGDKTNRLYVGDDVEVGADVSKELEHLLFDPQTAGGLLISIAPERAESLLARLQETYPKASVVGRVKERAARLITVK